MLKSYINSFYIDKIFIFRILYNPLILCDMKKNVVLFFTFLLFCCLNLSAVVVPDYGAVQWEPNSGVASGLLPITMDFDKTDNPQVYHGGYFTLFLAQGVVYEVVVYHAAWYANGAPSSFDIVYPDGQTTTIHIPNSPTTSGSGEAGKPVLLSRNE